MGYLTNGLIVLLCIGAVFTISQFAIVQFNPTVSANSNYTFIDCNDMPQSSMGTCSNTDPNAFSTNEQNFSGKTLAPETPSTTTFGSLAYNIVNTITSAWTWVTSPFTTGFKVVKGAVVTPTMALRTAGVSPMIVYTIGLLVVVMIIFWVSDWLKGGQA